MDRNVSERQHVWENRRSRDTEKVEGEKILLIYKKLIK